MHTHNGLVAAIAPLPARLGVNSDSVMRMTSTVALLTGLLCGIRLQVQIGATGVYRLPLTAALELHDRGARRALATMCIGFGQGISVLLESALPPPPPPRPCGPGCTEATPTIQEKP